MPLPAERCALVVRLLPSARAGLRPVHLGPCNLGRALQYKDESEEEEDDDDDDEEEEEDNDDEEDEDEVEDEEEDYRPQQRRGRAAAPAARPRRQAAAQANARLKVGGAIGAKCGAVAWGVAAAALGVG